MIINQHIFLKYFFLYRKQRLDTVIISSTPRQKPKDSTKFTWTELKTVKEEELKKKKFDKF